MDLDDVADELYALDPAEFVAHRTARAAEAREGGDRALATTITALRRPTTVGWLVNLLARESPDEVAALLRLGEELRDAQRQLSGEDLRQLSSQRQQVVHALARRAGRLAAQRGRKVGEGSLREVGQTLHAALADPEVADRVRAGRVVAAASYSGFGPAGLSVVAGRSPATTAAEPPDETVASAEVAADVLAGARTELAEATADLEQATETAERTRADLEQASEGTAAIEARIAALRGELERAEQERQFARSAETAAAEAAKQSESDLLGARRRVEEAERRLR
ncbi:hypothetical protein [Rhodococcus maanshanensis]|uniref:Uncharacterized protein n=1 Tax=Rhodococcus maanshanensis TaxID=183556 RepID=A0A1H7G5W8_9NOCA|nr:hypothetical protein [Rhodococcus maanshanensis]SEK31850.1 hypothetical protein SAMN05444583_101344 [Rhodococcus maanshanensis]